MRHVSVASQNIQLTTPSTAAHYIDHHPKLASSILGHWPEHGSNILIWIYETMIYEIRRIEVSSNVLFQKWVILSNQLSKAYISQRRCNRLLQVISDSSISTLTRREILALLCNLFSFARCAVAMASLFLISTSNAGHNTFIQSVANILKSCSSRLCSVFPHSYLWFSVFHFLVATVSLLVAILISTPQYVPSHSAHNICYLFFGYCNHPRSLWIVSTLRLQ